MDNENERQMPPPPGQGGTGAKMDYKVVKNIILTVVIQAIITFVSTLVIGVIDKPNIEVYISESIEEQNQYYTTITLKSYSKTSDTNLKIWLDRSINIKSLITDIKYQINDNNIQVIEMKPNYNGEIIIISDHAISNEKCIIEAEKGHVYWICNQGRYYYFIRVGIIYAIITIIEYGIVNYINKKRELKNKEEIENKNRELESSLAKTEEKIKKIECEEENIKSERETECKNLKREIKAIKIYYLKKSVDLSKELEFWKDTIRKIIYHKNIKEKDVFEIVTKNLETYRTLEKCNYHELDPLFEKFDKDNMKE